MNYCPACGAALTERTIDDRLSFLEEAMAEAFAGPFGAEPAAASAEAPEGGTEVG